MHPLGHITFACGSAWAVTRVADGLGMFHANSVGSDSAKSQLAERLDYRFVAFGALLPDIIDRPVGRILLRGLFDNNGHVIGHTLLFALLLLVPGIVLLTGRRQARLLCVGLGDLSHLAVDPVTHAPQTLLWPLLGSDFPQVTLLGPNATVATEITAGLIILSVLWTTVRRGRARDLLREGRL